MSARKLCVLTTHPIQYMAPWFRALRAEPDIELDVIFLRQPDSRQQGEGFGEAFAWDVPLRDGYPSVVLGIAPGWSGVPAASMRLWAHWRACKPERVLITGWNEPALMAAYPLARLLGIPILVRGEANLLRARSWPRRMLQRRLLALSSAALSIGSANRAFYLASGMPASRVFPGAYFVESQRMLAMAEAHTHERAALRAEHGHGPDDFVFCFVGKHVEFKRPALLLQAAALLRQRGLPVRIHLVGSGELTAALKAQAAALSVPTSFTGFLNQSVLWRAYVPADAFVLPSDSRETWGLVTNEAMLFGLPVVVCAQIGCAQDLVRDGETGYSFDGGVAELAAAMERLAENPAAARRMGAAGRALVVAAYSMPAATAGLKMALQAVR